MLISPSQTKSTTDDVPVSGRGLVSDKLFVILLVGAFAALQATSLITHEMWGDELQAWLIARDSFSIKDLLFNARFEGHPALWHLILFAVTRLTHEPFYMQLVHLALSTSAIFLLAKYSPFTRLQKVMIAFSYFLFFEYGTISRGYSLGNLALFSFCALYAAKPTRILALFCILAVLANTSMYGLIAAAVLGGAMLLQRSYEFVKRTQKFSWHWFAGSAILLAAGAGSALQITSGRLANHVAMSAPGLVGPQYLAYHRTLGYFLQRIGSSILPLWQGYFPIPEFNSHPWGSTIYTWNIASLMPVWSILAFSMMVLFCFSMRKSFIASSLYLGGTVAMLCFGFLANRHRGILFVVLIGSLWLARQTPIQQFAQTSRLTLRSVTDKLLSSILAVQVAVCTAFFYLDLVHPFSASKDVSEYIRQHDLSHLTIIGTPDWLASPLSAWTKKKVVFCERMTQGSFLVWDNRTCAPQTEAEFYDRIKSLMQERNITECLLVKGTRKTFSCPDLIATKLASFDNSILAEEQYALYFIQSKKD